VEIETNDHGSREWGTNRGQDRERVEKRYKSRSVRTRSMAESGEEKGRKKGA